MTQGPLNYTGRQMDVALNEGHFLAVALPGGEEAYTRNGSIQISADGQLMLGEHLLQGDGGAIDVPPHAELTIGGDGTITALIPTDPPTMLGLIAVDINFADRGFGDFLLTGFIEAQVNCAAIRTV